jgi:hypothetical protein
MRRQRHPLNRRAIALPGKQRGPIDIQIFARFHKQHSTTPDLHDAPDRNRQHLN